MTVLVENLQERIALNDNIRGLIERAVDYCLQVGGLDIPSEVSILFVDNEAIREINKEYRKIDQPTDVLSFPLVSFNDGKIQSHEGDVDLDENLLLLGDIVISMDKVESQALEYGHSFERELGFLTTHGMLHLLGYDHEDSKSEAIMLEMQEAVLERMGIARVNK
jgi:probable rRNA maturation factor